MKDFARRMIGIDRRIIFLLIAGAVLLPLLRPFGLPIKISPEVRAVYEYIEALPERSVFCSPSILIRPPSRSSSRRRSRCSDTPSAKISV